MTTQKFYDYLINLGLFRVKIWIDEIGVSAIILQEPFSTDFSQVKSLGDNRYKVKITKEDYNSEIITAGFFNN